MAHARLQMCLKKKLTVLEKLTFQSYECLNDEHMHTSNTRIQEIYV